jgi:endonuclease/exonuclease/phosphatase family metal-dependent hydrolase
MIFPPKPKPEDRIARLRENILRANPDIMTWQEVENMPAAEEFVATQLGGRYRVLLINGNDPLGLGIALLVRRDLPFDILLQSHRELENEGNRIFTRDFVTAEFRSPGSPSSQAPLFRIMNTHNKSQRNSPGDERSLARRTRQVEAQARIIQSMERRHPGVPSFLMGDMNAELRSAPELQGLWAIGYRDGFNVASETLPPEQRITQSYFPNNSEAVHSQLDGIIASPAAQAPGIVERMEVVADQFPDGRPMPLPRNLSERERQGSDHRALRMEVNFRRIYEIWRARN